MRRMVIILAMLALAAPAGLRAQTQDDAIFIHHSSGQNWLDAGLHNALAAKTYIDERNDLTYGDDIAPDSGRRDSLAPTPGDQTDMRHWILWFNDYVRRVKTHGCANGTNRIILFKSCFPLSNISSDGTEPGDPFSADQTLANYKAIYRHPSGPGGAYTNSGYVYKPLEDIFAENPGILFIPVTAPPQCYSATTDEEGRRARRFNNWLKTEWATNYTARHPGLNNVAVYDWFDVLAYADNHSLHPNRLKGEYGGSSSDSHPNGRANATSIYFFATCPTNFLDHAWGLFNPESRHDLFKLQAVALTNSVWLRWPDPTMCGHTDTTVHVRCDTSHYPSNGTDGTAVYTGTNRVFAHTNLVQRQVYYYTIWPESETP
ncbi:MAG: hypothetical protein V2A34_05230 [Lentisphaerota bacterium]